MPNIVLTTADSLEHAVAFERAQECALLARLQREGVPGPVVVPFAGSAVQAWLAPPTTLSIAQVIEALQV